MVLGFSRSPQSSASSSSPATPPAAAAEPTTVTEEPSASSSRAPSKATAKRGDALELVRAGSTSFTLRWRPPEDVASFEVEYRRTAWFVDATWTPQAVPAEDAIQVDDNGIEVKLSSLEPQTQYDVRLAAVFEDGTRHTSSHSCFRTLALAPSIDAPPSVQCARHDRLLLHWVGPATQADEVVAYKVRYYDCEPRWPVKHEVEAKLASRLLRPSEQTAQFLQGLVAMPVQPVGLGVAAATSGSAEQAESVAQSDEESCTESGSASSTGVHFWLMSLAPSRMYYVQVAAVTAGGLGQWSPRSSPLFTWRVAPTLTALRPLFRTHASIVVGLDLEQMDDSVQGQDEEVDKLEITLSPLAKGKAAEESQTVVAAREDASALAARLRPLLWQGPQQSEDGDESQEWPNFAVAVGGLSPSSSYTCAGRTLTLAGVGATSSASVAETLAVPSEVADLRLDSTRHDAATISWCVHDECPVEAVVASFGAEEADTILESRRLRGFKVRVADRHKKSWNEVIGVRAPLWLADGDHGGSSRTAASPRRVSVDLEGLEPNSICFAQVAAVARGGGEGQWCEALEINTERCAPVVGDSLELDSVTRCGGVISWPTPQEINESAPVNGYVVHFEREKNRQASMQQFDVPISDGHITMEEIGSETVRVWREGDKTKAALGGLEPGAAYAVQVAARTARGVGERSSVCRVLTRPHAPDMGGGGSCAPWCLEAYWNRLLMRCEGPVPDWDHGETSDVKKYRARFYECARFGPNGAWMERDVEFAVAAPTDGAAVGHVDFWIEGLQPEKQHVIQVAAVTDAGQGPWSKPSERVSTWRVAPGPRQPRVLFRTHTAFVVGWDMETLVEERVHDEEVQEFVLRMTPSSGSARAEAKTLQVTRSQSAHYAESWQLGCGSRGGLGGSSSSSSDAVLDAVVAPLRCADDARGAATSSSSAARWPDTMLCEDPEGCSPSFVATIHGLTPSRCYACTVSAVTGAGEGRASPASAEMGTLAIAPMVEGLLVDEVFHDQIQVSWEHIPPRRTLAPAVCDQLGLAASIEELELRGYAVRCAAWTSWTRLSWREPAYAEVDALSNNDAGVAEVDFADGQTCDRRVHFAVENLEPEQQYVVEVRAHSSRGAGEWRRVGDQPVCTAIVAPPPPAPELVYATPHALTFSFAGVEDPRTLAYEVRKVERWAGGWCRPSNPIKFDAKSLAVRITSEKRWIVHMDQLQSDTTYALQLRGVTQAGGVTKWSTRSEAMRTLRANEAGEDTDAGVGVNEGRGVSGETVGANSGLTLPVSGPPPANDGGVESVDDFSKKLEAILSFTMDYATAGVKLPSGRIPSVKEKAEELMEKYDQDVSKAVEAAALLEDDASGWRTKLPDFLIQQVPVVGCSTLLLRELWRSIRRTALIAHLYGHDTRLPETQALILTCLVPAGNGTSSAGGAGAAGAAIDADVVAGSRKVALIVSRALAKETFVRATGLKYAGSVVSLLEVAGRTLKIYNEGASGARGTGGASSIRGDGECVSGGSSSSTSVPEASSTEANAATDAATRSAPAFRSGVDVALGLLRVANPRRAISHEPSGANEDESGAIPSCGSAVDESRPVTPERVALVLFRPQQMEERVVYVGLLLALWLLPIIVSTARFIASRLLPLLAKRIQMELPIVGVAAVLIAAQVIAVLGAVWVHKNLHNFLSVPATLVFAVYSAIPGVSMCMAMRSVLQGAAEAPFFALLGLFNLSSGYLRWANDLHDDALLENRPEPRVAKGRERIKAARDVLWIALLLDFVVEELLGRVCNMHSIRILGPPLSDAGVTLTEYRTLSFAMGLIAAAAQARLLELLQRRTVLLRMLGARKAIFAGLSLLLMGAYAVVQQRTTLGFLRDSSPTPWWCCAVLWLRQLGAVVGVVLPVVFHMLLQPHYLGAWSSDSLVPTALAIGVVLGHMVSSSFTALWLEKKEHLESDYRVLYLFPHMSAQARGKASVAMRVAFKRGKEATQNTAMEWAVARMARSLVNYAARAFASRAAGVEVAAK